MELLVPSLDDFWYKTGHSILYTSGRSTNPQPSVPQADTLPLKHIMQTLMKTITEGD